MLDLSQTGLAALPGEALGLQALRRLTLSGNRLAQLPPELARLTRLEELDVSNNDLASLPPQLGWLAPPGPGGGGHGSLRALSLEGNPLRLIRRPILERGTLAVLEYLRDRIPA